ncbi:hypothetical protein TNCV_1773261 [Trichonephila clavipes]|nr:hypothetical protein TNCV_1773261 [Trichonephila clavipes]
MIRWGWSSSANGIVSMEVKFETPFPHPEQSSVFPDLGVVRLGAVGYYLLHVKYRLLRRQSSQPGPRRSRRGLCKQDNSYGPRGKSLGRRGQASVPANLPENPVQFIALNML